MRGMVFWLLLVGAAAARADDDMQCPNGIVSAGMVEDEIRAACGEPTFRERVGATLPGAEYDEEWLYNFGPRKLLRILRLREGRLVLIEDDGFGFNQPPKLSCDFYSLRERMSKFRLLLACDKPSRRETLAAYRSTEGSAVVLPIVRERWHYNAASGERVRTVIMENGRIVSVEEKKPRPRF